MIEEREQVQRDFHAAVNMTRWELDDWLSRQESQAVGATGRGNTKATSEGDESVGHASGRRIMAILDKNRRDLTDDDYAHMRKVVSYVRRHLAQQPQKEAVEHSRWRYSLMNWGHDPLKKTG